MAERSMFWTTGTTGDGATTYTEAQWGEFLRDLFTPNSVIGTPNAAEGVLRGAGDELAVTGSSSPVSVATGAAIGEGFYYRNTAAVSVAIPTPAANTRIDRIVLRVSHGTTRTVRVTRIAGTEGAGAPALTQTAGTTWDIPLAQVSITTGGVITLTDQRGFCHFATRISASMLDYPLLRQGNNASDWQYPGVTTYTPAAWRQQVGATSVTVSGASGSVTVTFPVAFANSPLVVASIESSYQATLTTLSSSGSVTFTVWASPGTYNISWLAIGPAA